MQHLVLTCHEALQIGHGTDECVREPTSRERDLRFNHLSNGRQDCPGGPLVLLLGKAVLAAVLQRFDLSLTAPELPTEGALPMMLDFYAIALRVGPRRSR